MIASACLVLLLLSPQRPPTTQQQIQAQYDRWSKAYMAKDTDTLLSILTPDYTLTNAEGTTISRAQYEVSLKLRAKAAADPTKYSTKIKKLVEKDGQAIVTAIETMESKSEDSKTHKSITILHRHEYQDTWHPHPPTWELQKTVTVKESTTKK